MQDRPVLLVQPNDDNREMYAEYLRHFGVPTVAIGTADEAFALAPTAAVVVTGSCCLARPAESN